MKEPAVQRVPAQPHRMSSWRPFFAKILAFTLVFSFIVGLVTIEAPAATACGSSSVCLSLDNSDDTAPDSGVDDSPVGHTAHCVAHAMAQNEAAVVEPAPLSTKAGFRAHDSISSLSNLNPPERPPRG